RGEAGARGDHRLPQGSPEISAAGRPASQRRPLGRAARHGQDAAREGRGGRGGAAVLLDVGIGLRGDVRGGGRLTGARPVRAGQGPRALHHLHRRDRRRRAPPRRGGNLERTAKGAPGLSGAERWNSVNEAPLPAARRNKGAVDMNDLEDAKDKVMLGLERKSMVLSDEERRLTAYHEAGHALVSLKVPGLDPLHKVTIVPRGRALGITFSLPEEDRHNYTKQYIVGRLAMAYGGRVAEELVFGPEKVTTGAAADIQQATEMARRMVTQFGMSDVVGP